MDKIADKIKSVNKRYERLDNAMRFLVNNAFTFTVGVMGLVHVVLMIIFWIAGVIPLAQFNFFSVVVYAFCFVLCRFGHLLPVYVSIILSNDLFDRIHILCRTPLRHILLPFLDRSDHHIFRKHAL